MDVILHLGAHRTATTAFQAALRMQARGLAGQGMAVWTPHVTRTGLLAGVLPGAGPQAPGRQLDRARGRIALALARAEQAGMTRVLITDENILGTPRGNIKARALYPAAGFRLVRHGHALGPQLRHVHLTLRPLDSYWASLLAFSVARGAPVPGPAARAAIAANSRGWRAVIRDIACALPGVDIRVGVHAPQDCATRCAAITDGALAPGTLLPRINAAPDLAGLRQRLRDAGGDPDRLGPGQGAWQPFAPDHRARLRDIWADDLAWLRAGADGLATLTETKGATDPIMMTRGYSDDDCKGCVA